MIMTHYMLFHLLVLIKIAGSGAGRKDWFELGQAEE